MRNKKTADAATPTEKEMLYMNHYTMFSNKRKARILLAVFMLIATLAIRWAFSAMAPKWTPDSVHPMTNASVSWDQTFYAGSWSDVR